MATLITGATGGLGNAFTIECAKRGDTLVLTGTNSIKLDAILSRVKTEFPDVKVFARTCDLSSEEARKGFFEWLKEEKIEIDFLINNAGYITEGEFLLHSDEEILKVIRVNCEGTIDVTQKVIKMRNKDVPLHILTVASLAGYYPMPYMNIYASTKAMLKNFMIALAYEMKKKNVFVTTICPSGIPTTQAMKDAIASQGAGGKMTMSTPEEVAKLGLKASKKHKVVVIPKSINRFIRFISMFVGDKALAKIVGKRWKKSQEKRNFKSEETK